MKASFGGLLGYNNEAYIFGILIVWLGFNRVNYMDEFTA